VPTIRNSEEGRRLAEARWRKHREREAAAVRLAEAWADDALSLAVLTKAQQRRLIGNLLRQGVEGTLCEVAPSVVLACAEVGIDRAAAERIADLAVLLTATAIEQAGGPEVALPPPETWRATVAWEAIYAQDGRSLVTGRLRASRRPRRPSRPAGADPSGPRGHVGRPVGASCGAARYHHSGEGRRPLHGLPRAA